MWKRMSYLDFFRQWDDEVFIQLDNTVDVYLPLRRIVDERAVGCEVQSV